MGSALHDYTMILISSRKEDKKRKKGDEQNKSLPPRIKEKVDNMVARLKKGNYGLAYDLGLMYLDGEEVGYNPNIAVQYLEIGAKNGDFNSQYALALYYRGHWSYTHVDAYKSMMYYIDAANNKNGAPEFVKEANRAYYNDFFRESTKKGLQVVFKVDIPIK